MKLALECPTRMLPLIQPLADFDFILAHLVLKDKAYADYYASSSRLKVLDDSTNELLRPLSLQEIKAAAEIVKPDIIVPPDFLGDAKATLTALKEAEIEWPTLKLMPVVQGSSMAEVYEFLKEMVDRGYERVAIPFDITCKRTDSLVTMGFARAKVVRAITNNTYFWSLSMHLLGMTTLSELSGYAANLMIESIDTGSPVLHGQMGIPFGYDKLLQPKLIPTMNSIATLEHEEPNYTNIFYNIAFLRKVLNGEDDD